MQDDASTCLKQKRKLILAHSIELRACFMWVSATCAWHYANQPKGKENWGKKSSPALRDLTICW